MKLPREGLSKNAVLERLDAFAANDLPWREGNTFAYVYDPGREAEEVLKAALTRFMSENALDPTVYPSLARMEAEVLAIAAAHLGGDENVVGNFTSGGTESVLLSVKTARDYARAERGIAKPDLVLPVTAHACFHKACAYFDVTPILVPVSGPSWRVDPAAMEAAISPDTIMLVASAPQYAHGVVDPIAEIGAIAERRKLLFHVDACVGGWMLPFFRQLGASVPAFDFSVPGVTQMSMDFHKFAYAAKGASIVLYRDKALRQHQIFTGANWTGYSVINPTVLSTRGGGPLAACWAILHYLGEEGYLGFARNMLEATRTIIARLSALPGIEVMGKPDFSLVAFCSDEFNVFTIPDLMKARGWFVQPQLGFMGSKPNIHLSIDQAKLSKVERFLDDLEACILQARQLPPPAVPLGLLERLSALRLEDLSPALFHQILAAAGASEGLPKETASINTLLNVLKPEVAGALMSAYFNELGVQAR
ncbi:MAG: aspartate aminotransferase family protein [Phycisphaerales bacterium]|nr:aspartate aminotransferase family protein [Hyphomonadaceae bacterium]